MGKYDGAWSSTRELTEEQAAKIAQMKALGTRLAKNPETSEYDIFFAMEIETTLFTLTKFLIANGKLKAIFPDELLTKMELFEGVKAKEFTKVYKTGRSVRLH